MEPYDELWKNFKKKYDKYISEHAKELCIIEMALYSVGCNKKIFMLLLHKIYPHLLFTSIQCLSRSSDLQNITSAFWFSFMSCD